MDFIVCQQPAQADEYEMLVQGDMLISLRNEKQKEPLAIFKNKTVHAVAAIGNPEKFFTSLRSAGVNVITHVFPDHYFFQQKDLEFGDGLPVIMTEKDAVKYKRFAGVDYWYMPIVVTLSADFEEKLLQRLKSGLLGTCAQPTKI
jgi:tetraacyldisaccharide 4'-kinase